MQYQENRFTQILDNALEMIGDLISESPTAVKILIFMIKNMRKKDNAIAVSQAILSDRLNCSRSSVSVSIKKLAEKNWIEIVKVGNMNVYVVNERVAWCNHNRSRSTALFSATIYADKSEQPSDIDDKDCLFSIPDPDTLKHLLNKKLGIV